MDDTRPHISRHLEQRNVAVNKMNGSRTEG